MSRGVFAWYFYPSLTLPLRLILFSWVAWSLGYAAYYSLIRAYAVVKVAWAVPASVSIIFAVIIILMVAPILLAIELAPLTINIMQFSGIPAVVQEAPSRRARVLRLVGVLLGAYVAAMIAAWIGITVIGWIADLNPCASWRAGVTGSVPPPATCQ